ncbi:hypothetical protein GCM10007868_30820 [Gluconobacter frateurii]|uniref:TMhelix containing protein n=1 Tax=Gluconobacter frateurii NRIC 0228 TaxID=1307946 RepID=A0ABQ0QD54_9PROT|nr:hypothetical protein AA0228_2177 [Gluconobacter frateurii NRIC 0228]GLP92007.1 hypothetical protein GCM10007868_30820 [Gluconobacter frateurii]
MDKITEYTKLIITCAAVLIGFTNLVIFPIIDLFDPDANLIKTIVPIAVEIIKAFVQ